MDDAIPAFDYTRELAWYRRDVDAAIARVLESGWLILGPEVEAFQREFADKLGISHAIGVASGTDALILALRALGIQAGDLVITVANTAVPTIAAIRAIGALPRFVDIDLDTLQMSVDALRNCLRVAAHDPESRVRCILMVHLHGCPADAERIVAVAQEFSLPVIGDCAQAHGSAIKGQSVATFGDICCYSFYPTKNLGAFGDGGLCVTDSDLIAGRLRELRQYGFRNDRMAHSEGVCSRLDELQAAILRVRLQHFENAQNQRQAIAARYRNSLSDSQVKLPASLPNFTHGWHQFVIRSPHREQLGDRLKQARIGFGIHYPTPIHFMPAYRFLGYRAGDLPNTERAATEILSLPMFPGLREDEIDRVTDAIRHL